MNPIHNAFTPDYQKPMKEAPNYHRPISGRVQSSIPQWNRSLNQQNTKDDKGFENPYQDLSSNANKENLVYGNNYGKIDPVKQSLEAVNKKVLLVREILSKERKRNERALLPSKYNNYVSNENQNDITPKPLAS